VEKPDVYNLSSLEWQLFVTLTKARDNARPGALRKHWFSLCRRIACYGGIHFRELLWMLRIENGEIGDRFHFHALVGGLPPHVPTLSLCYAIQEWWEHSVPLVVRQASRLVDGKPIGRFEMLSRDCGMARVRIYDPSMNGLDYNSPDSEEGKASTRSPVNGANRYEATKFGGASSVEYSKSVCERLQRIRRWSYSASRAVQLGQGTVRRPALNAGQHVNSGDTKEQSLNLAITGSPVLNQQKVKPAPDGALKIAWREHSTGVYVPIL
jgi:hypothetical protein